MNSSGHCNHAQTAFNRGDNGVSLVTSNKNGVIDCPNGVVVADGVAVGSVYHFINQTSITCDPVTNTLQVRQLTVLTGTGWCFQLCYWKCSARYIFSKDNVIDGLSRKNVID